MRDLESKIFKIKKNDDLSERQKSEKLLESEVSINSDVLRKIAINPILKKAFYTIALSVGLLIGGEALAQKKSDEKEPESEKIENVTQKNEETNIEQVIEEFSEYIKNSEHFSKYPHSLISWVAAAEKPSEYQAQQIISLHNQISESAQSEKFKSKIDLMVFINYELDSNFSSQNAYVNFKDIFSEKEDQDPKANFDCDSRAVMISSILQNLGYTNQDITMCELEGHMVMYSKKENVYFETTTNKIIELTQEQKSQLNHITTPEKYFAHLLSNQGTALALEAESNWFRGYIDKEKSEQAVRKLKQAIELDSNNITAKLNLIYLLTHGDRDPEKLTMVIKLHQELLSDLVYNYHGIEGNSEEVTLTPKTKLQQEIPGYEPTLEELTAKAIQESDYIKDKFEKYADFAYYKAENYQEAATTYKLLLENLPNNEKESITADIYRLGIINSLFNIGDFDSYLMNVDNTIEILSAGKNSIYWERYLNKLEAQKLVVIILSGKLDISEDNIQNIIKEYKYDPLLGPIISGAENWNINYIDAVETLRSWQGYENFRKLIEKSKNE